MQSVVIFSIPSARILVNHSASFFEPKITKKLYIYQKKLLFTLKMLKNASVPVHAKKKQIELRAISAGFDLNPKLGQTLTQKFVVVKDFVLVVTGARRVRLVSAE